MWSVCSVQFLQNLDRSFSSAALKKRSPSSVSAADKVTNCRRDVRMWIGSFKFIGWLSWRSHLRKKWSVTWLFVMDTPRYDTSEWVESVIPEFLYLIFVSRCLAVSIVSSVAILLTTMNRMISTVWSKWSILSTTCLSSFSCSLIIPWQCLLGWDLGQLCHISWQLLGTGYLVVVLFKCSQIFRVACWCILA